MRTSGRESRNLRTSRSDPSRGPIVDQVALIEALQARRIASAALDVFDAEPLPADHPYIGYVTEELYRTFYGDAAASIAAWLNANAPLKPLTEADV
jgi:phosphoglycerate dehydrogenase-like enzyme